MPTSDPYQVLGVSRTASDEEIRTAYRRLVQLHHPDHNNGSEESERRFEEVQDAYARVLKSRREAPAPGPSADPEVETRIADLERQVREAHAARERAQRAAQEAAAQTERRPSDEELGYVTTEDTLSQVLDDARSELAARFGEGGNRPTAARVADLLEELAAKLRRESRGDR
ncbi:MAG: J domain-containing protein [Solirubrobacteraceae bacterium]